MANKQPKPKLNNALMQTTGAYIPLYDITPVDVSQNVWKGRPILPVAGGDTTILPSSSIHEAEWIFFTREYDFERNDWDPEWHSIAAHYSLYVGRSPRFSYDSEKPGPAPCG